MISTELGLSKFIESPENISNMRNGLSSLGCGIGMHSKDFATLLVQLGMCMMSSITVSSYTSHNTKGLGGIPPQIVISKSIFAVVSLYMEIRRSV